MRIVADINEFLKRDKVNESLTLTKQHFTWFLDILADACKKNQIRRIVYLKLVESVKEDFAKTNDLFKPEIFMAYAKKIYVGKDEEHDDSYYRK